MRFEKNQKGFSLMELLISLSLGVAVTASMVALMSSSLHNTSRIVQMNKLTEDLRLSMQMMSRDIRRASYSANAIYCLGNPGCSSLGEISEDVGWILMPGDVNFNDDNDCVWFLTDRDQDGDGTEDDAGGFRLSTVNLEGERSVGQIEMWIGGSEPDCGAANSADWVALTDADQIDITAFSVNNDQSFDEVLLSEVSGAVSTVTTTQRVRRIEMSISGELVDDADVTRTITNSIKIRNNYWF